MALRSNARLDTALLNLGCVVHLRFVQRYSTEHGEEAHE